MSELHSNQRVMNLNDFLYKEFEFCFTCGSKEYIEFFMNNALYRQCKKCVHNNRDFFIKRLTERRNS